MAWAKRLDAVLHIVHIIDTSFHWQEQPYEPEESRGAGHTIQDEVEAELDRLVAFARDADVKAERHWRAGATGEQVLHLVDVLGSELVVMSTRALDKPRLTVQGSVYLEVVRDADVPVLGVKTPEHEFVKSDTLTLDLGRVLCPCDLSTFSRGAIPYAVQLCRAFDAELVLAHLSTKYEDYYKKPEANLETDEAPESIEEALQSYASACPELRSRIVHVEGRALTDLAALCERENAGLVVIATHGRKPLVRSIMGSVTERLVVDAPCPLLTLRPDEIAKRFGAPATY